MVRGSVTRRLVGALGAWLLLAVVAPAAHAFEYFEGRIQVHGYFEETVRAISTNFNEGLDLTQWYNILHLELDIDIAKDGWGPFDSVSGYIGAEVRYDCVWTRACGISPSVDVYGNRSERLPSRLSDAKDPRLAGVTRYQNPIVREPDRWIETTKVYPAVNDASPPARVRFGERTDTYRGLNQTSPIGTLLDTRNAIPYGGTDFTRQIDYIPGRYTFSNFLSYGFALRAVRSGTDGMGMQQMPWDPKDNIDPNATLADKVSPFRPLDMNPIIGTIGQSLPYRPGPNYAPLEGPSHLAKGLFVPSAPYSRYVLDGGTDKFDQNFSQDELAWNRGASQQQTKELKEAYLDVEMLSGSLFLRLGRQTIVWGKTELFATTDLFNPTDFALGSLTSLEESRIPLWAMRAIYSFYEVGPFEDVRLEVALDLDDFTPTDIGRCGEAYTPNPVCDKTMGLLIHGMTGLALAGEDRPPHWWQSWEGLQGGARLEFRWDRFSFALVDFWNYTKLPYADRLSTFSRNVDPTSGMPRRYGATGPCTTGKEPACLQPGEDALLNSPLNQQLYAVICSGSVGFTDLEVASCAQSVLSSSQPPTGNPIAPVPQLLSQILSGSTNGINTLGAFALGGGAFPFAPLVALSLDTPDLAKQASGFAGGGATGLFAFPAILSGAAVGQPGFANNHNAVQTLAQVLTVEQQALLGCGPFYRSSCDGGASNALNDRTYGFGGIDLLNADASALVQSWAGIDGSPLGGMLTSDPRAQPGTVGFQGGPVCTYYENGQTYILPGCRGPNDPGYVLGKDGGAPFAYVDANGNVVPAAHMGLFAGGLSGLPPLTDPRWGAGKVTLFAQGHPFTGQAWQSEIAAFSWNLQALLVAFSTKSTDPSAAGDPGSDPTLRLDVANVWSTSRCSFVAPWLCSAVRSFWGVLGVTRNDVRAGGTSRFGRRDFVWAQGGEAVLSYQKRNVLGFSSDFAEDVTKTNWGVEFTWVRNNPYTDQNKYGGINKTDALNLTFSVDRPTFINFLNQSRTFFFNSQWFFSYVPGYHNSFTTNGPWNIFFTFTTQTGYFQDRLLPGITWVYDVQSESGAALPSVTYRFTESFSATFGFALFWGRYEGKDLALNPLTPGNQAGAWAYRAWVENGLAAIRDRDEVYMRLRYTF